MSEAPRPRADAHRQLLVRCVVKNATEAESIRYVEHSHYRLWQYMMANKHAIRVLEANVCLWLPESEWQSQPDVFTRAGTDEAVNRVSLAVFESQAGLCTTSQRFVIARDTTLVRELLLERVPEPARSNGDFAFEAEMGRAIIRDDLNDLASVGRQLQG